MNQWKTKIIRDPFAHFLALGTLLFALSWAFDGLSDKSQTIVVSEADIARLEALWETQYSRPPTSEERVNLIDQFIQEEVLYREAVKLDLAEDDIIVRRRLVQKFSFLFEDAIQIAPPTQDQLAQFYDTHNADYTVPPKASFRQVYFNADKPGAKARAEETIKRLNTPSADTDAWRRQGDPFMMQREYALRDEAQISGYFGTSFAREVLALEPVAWQGPFPSAYGWHAVLVLTHQPEHLPPLEAIRDEVSASFIAERRVQANAAFRDTLRKKYKVLVRDPEGEGPENEDPGNEDKG